MPTKRRVKNANLLGVVISRLLGVVAWANGAPSSGRWTGDDFLSDLAALLLGSVAIRWVVTSSMQSSGVCWSSGLLRCSMGGLCFALAVCRADLHEKREVGPQSVQ